MNTGIRKIFRGVGVILLFLVVAIMTGWAVCAIYYSNLPGYSLRTVLSVTFGVATLAAFIVLPSRGRTLAWFFIICAVIAVWWALIPASNERSWQQDVAILPYATIRGDEITIHNIRNFNYRTETDFDVLYYDKTFNLKKLDSVDLIAVYWMGDAIAHIMMSFGFEGKDYVTFSIETRKEKGEEYSTIKRFSNNLNLSILPVMNGT